jgi:tetratricopeptide (TPR) repeat protein
VPSTRTVEAIVLACVGAAAGIACIIDRDSLVNHPGPEAAGQGHVAFPLVLGACAATALVAFLVFRFVAAPLERRTARVGRVGRAVAAGFVVVLVAAGVAAAHPVRLFEQFKEPPADPLNALSHQSQNPVREHLLSAGSSGRWQQWASAVDEFETAPGLGKGAGSYEAWWAQHGTLGGFVKDAHSLYLESLGELGIVGFLLIVAAFVAGLVVGARRVLRRAGEERIALAAVWAGFLAYAVAAGIDWMWELTVVSVVGIALLGLLTSGATAADAPARPLRARWDIAARVALAAVGVFAILAVAISLLSNRELQASQNAAARGDVATAFERADNARKIEPWAASPYQQLALVAEEAGEYADAEHWIRKAIRRAPDDWRAWFLLTRFRAESGQITAALLTLKHTRDLNPRSELLSKVQLAR